MPRPVLVKLGGSLLTDKAKEATFRRNVARRLLGELAKAKAPLVLLHGAGSFGHPQAARHAIGRTKAKPAGVAEVLSAVGSLHAQVVELAAAAGLNPLSFPLHAYGHRDGDGLSGLPVAAMQQALDAGFTPMACGTLVQGSSLGWDVVSADEAMALLAAELQPRLAVFATDVDGVFGQDPKRHAGASVLPKVDAKHLRSLQETDPDDDDVTGRMQGKLGHALAVAQHAPTVILNGLVRNRLLDALKGKSVPGTRVVA